MKQVVYLRPDDFTFPPVSNALNDPPGLLAVGGDLQPQRLLNAYASGVFPWFDDSSPILWWSPDPRMVLKPEEIHVSRSLAKTIKRSSYRISMDEAFPDVIASCAALRQSGPGTWIVCGMQEAYIRLHQMGHAHSVEVWDGSRLIGGLYGVSMGQLFFGESMFSLLPDASKIAFVALARQLQQWSYKFIDCQMPTAHLQSMGASAMSRQKFKLLLSAWRDSHGQPAPWKFDSKLMKIK
jgi:leucyl/phenylalanyl-tRNA---protein transferase